MDNTATVRRNRERAATEDRLLRQLAARVPQRLIREWSSLTSAALYAAAREHGAPIAGPTTSIPELLTWLRHHLRRHAPASAERLETLAAWLTERRASDPTLDRVLTDLGRMGPASQRKVQEFMVVSAALAASEPQQDRSVPPLCSCTLAGTQHPSGRSAPTTEN